MVRNEAMEEDWICIRYPVIFENWSLDTRRKRVVV